MKSNIFRGVFYYLISLLTADMLLLQDVRAVSIPKLQVSLGGGLGVFNSLSSTNNFITKMAVKNPGDKDTMSSRTLLGTIVFSGGLSYWFYINNFIVGPSLDISYQDYDSKFEGNEENHLAGYMKILLQRGINSWQYYGGVDFGYKFDRMAVLLNLGTRFFNPVKYGDAVLLNKFIVSYGVQLVYALTNWLAFRTYLRFNNFFFNEKTMDKISKEAKSNQLSALMLETLKESSPFTSEIGMMISVGL